MNIIVNFFRRMICKITGHKWYLSLYTDYKYKHCSRCGICILGSRRDNEG